MAGVKKTGAIASRRLLSSLYPRSHLIQHLFGSHAGDPLLMPDSLQAILF